MIKFRTMEKNIFKKQGVIFSVFIFFIISFFIFIEREKIHLIYPLLSLSLIPLERKKYEFKFLIILVGSFMAFLLPHFSPIPRPDVYLIMAVELFCFWGFAYIIHEFQEDERKKSELTETEISKNLYELKNVQNELLVYKTHMQKLKKQIEVKKNLSGIIKDLQQVNNIEEIKQKIQSFLEKSFPDFKIEIISEFGQNDFLGTICKSKIPVLIKNVAIDVRYNRNFFKPDEKSIIAVPLIISGKVLGVIKMSSAEVDKLSEEELRTMEILATISSISMENLNLFKKVSELAVRDPLTGLYTHRYFQEKLDDEILRSARSKIPFSLIIADIDHFKKINDTYGHQVGDIVLKKTADLFSSSVREIDFIARYGGEEFVFILPGIEKLKAFEFAEFLRKNISLLSFAGLKDPLSASFGMSEFPREAVSKSQLIRLADERLYKAKNSGRNICIYE